MSRNLEQIAHELHARRYPSRALAPAGRHGRHAAARFPAAASGPVSERHRTGWPLVGSGLRLWTGRGDASARR
jgi:hypothetical protein